MKKFILTLYFLLIVFCVLLINNCNKNSNPQSTGSGDTITYFWLAAIKDANVRSDMPEFNGSGLFSLVVAHGAPNGEQRSYIKFFMPQLPSGSKVLEA
jgi:hypothetical protein